MQKHQSASRRSRRKVERQHAPGKAAPRARSGQFVDVVETVVRDARPVQLEEADWVLDENTIWPVDEEAHPRSTKARSGTLSDDPDGQRLPVVEPGLSIDPEDLGLQFLRDATEQDNFESAFDASSIDPSASALEQVISEASLEASAQAGFALPDSAALGGSDARERALEPQSDVVDLVSSVRREASLFDQPTEDGDTRVPLIFADEQEPHNAHRRPEPEPGVAEQNRRQG